MFLPGASHSMLGANVLQGEGRCAAMSEQPGKRRSTAEDEANEATATSEGFSNVSVEEDAEGMTNPADLAGTAKPEDDD